MYYYRLYGLNIKSEIPIKPLDCREAFSDSIADLFVNWGRVPCLLRQVPLKKGICYQAAEGEFIFEHKSIGVSAYVKNLSEVIIDKEKNIDIDTTILYLLGSVMGAVLMMKGYVPLHASSVLTDRGAVVFIGVSGAGKSTMAWALQQRGYQALTDDICPVKIENGIPFAYPGHSNLKLWESALTTMKEKFDHLPKIRNGINKYYYSLENTHCGEKYKVCKIYNLETHNVDKIEILPVEKGIDKLQFLKNNTYRKQFVEGLAGRRAHFRISSALANLPIARIRRPSITSDFNLFIDLVEKDIVQLIEN